MPELRAFAPGRVNLMGDHTDQTGGRVLPIAVDLGTEVHGQPGGDDVVLRSTWAGADVRLSRFVDAVVAEVRPPVGFSGTIDTTLPVGAGLSSSAALSLSLALALGFDGSPTELAQLGQRVEQRATGVPCGVMDQLASAAGVAGHALRIDCHTLEVRPVPVPDGIEVLVVHSGVERTLADTPYAERVTELGAAEAVLGPLRSASPDALAALRDPALRRRARHVITENGRVDELATALAADDHGGIREVLAASHESLRDDFQSTGPAVDQLVAELGRFPGVLGARCTGAGWGGCVVALAEAGAGPPGEWLVGRRAWRVGAADGATCVGAARPSWPRTPRR